MALSAETGAHVGGTTGIWQPPTVRPAGLWPTPRNLKIGTKMIVLGAILLIIGLLVGISLLTTVGSVLVVVGAVLWILGASGRKIGGRKHYF